MARVDIPRTRLFPAALLLVLVAPLVAPEVQATHIVIFEDDFNDGLPNEDKWNYRGAVEDHVRCGSLGGIQIPPQGRVLTGAGKQATYASTTSLDVSDGGTISFYLRLCTDLQTPTYSFKLQYSNRFDSWTDIELPGSSSGYSSFKLVEVDIPSRAQTDSTSFRWGIFTGPLEEPTLDSVINLVGGAAIPAVWAINNVVITGNNPYEPPGPSSNSHSVPGEAESKTVPSGPLDTPPIPVPATCSFGPCISDTPLGTAPIPVPEICAPMDIICIDDFIIPGQHLATIPAICSEVEIVCIPAQIIPSQHLADIPAISAGIDFSGLDIYEEHPSITDPASWITVIGPIHQPIGPTGVTICGDMCPFVVLPWITTTGSITVSVVIDGDQYGQTIPLNTSTRGCDPCLASEAEGNEGGTL